MVQQEIVAYLKTETDKGFKMSELKSVLRKKGWKRRDIDEAASLVIEKEPVKAPEQPKKLRHRNPILVLFLTLFTAGLFGLYWIVVSSKELKPLAKDSPNPKILWLLLIPVVGAVVWIVYLRKFSQAVFQATSMNPLFQFFVLLILFPLGVFMVQEQFNKKN